MERGENGRKHVIKNAGQNTLKTHEEDVLENTMKLQEDMITIRGNRQGKASAVGEVGHMLSEQAGMEDCIPFGLGM